MCDMCMVYPFVTKVCSTGSNRIAVSSLGQLGTNDDVFWPIRNRPPPSFSWSHRHRYLLSSLPTFAVRSSWEDIAIGVFREVVDPQHASSQKVVSPNLLLLLHFVSVS